MKPTLLLVAKAPVPGRAKTRLTPPFTPHQAAALAAAALLDTLDVVEAAAADVGAEVVVALTGDLDQAVAADALRMRLAGVRVIGQWGEDFADRLANAHLEAAGADGVCVQVGMDTPQLSAEVLAQAVRRLAADDEALLGPATDGGWWVLGLRRAHDARHLRGVPMSTPGTGAATRAVLSAAGLAVGRLPELTDVDTVAEVHQVADLGRGRFTELAYALTGESRMEVAA